MQWLVKEGADRDHALRLIRFWLQSIVVHARGRRDSTLPPIALVGTHKDQVDAQSQQESVLDTLRPAFKHVTTEKNLVAGTSQRDRQSPGKPSILEQQS